MIIVVVGVLGVLFALFDAIWLKTTNKYYRKELGGFLRKKPNMLAVVLFYIMYTLGVTWLVLYPALTQHWSMVAVLVQGAVLGGFAYATYDLTNLATIKNWPTRLVIIDILWGTALTTGATCLAFILLEGWFTW